MSAAIKSAEQLALQGLLLLVVEVQNQAREAYAAEPSEFDAQRCTALDQIATLVDDPKTIELVQLARAALETPAAPLNRRSFYCLVTQYDCDERYRAEFSMVRPDGPLVWETYLNEGALDRKKFVELAATRAGYGWCRIAEIHVDIPDPSEAIPAAAAGVHA